MKKVSALLFSLVIALSVSAQFEVGLSPGVSFYTGDIAPTTQLTSAGSVGPSLGAFARVQFHPNLAARINFAFARVSADDFKAEDQGRRNRNLNFNTNIWEAALIGEVHFPPVHEIGWIPSFGAYVFGGLGVFNFNPKTEFNGETVELQPLGTEGQGLPGFQPKYSLTEIAIPVGVGIKFGIAHNLSLGFEFGTRITFTDYLDDVSTVYAPEGQLAAVNGALAAELAYRRDELPGQDPNRPSVAGAKRGSADYNDFYHISTVSIIYHFGSGSIGGGGGGRGGKCYKF